MGNNVVKIRRSYVPGAVPTAAQLFEGQLALNVADKVLYVLDNSNNVVTVGGAGYQPISLTGDVTASSTNGVLATTLAASGVTAGVYTQVTVDAKGRVTTGANPTTLAGYGITDALPLSGGTVTGNIIMSGATVRVPTPILDTDAANKIYVDNAINGVNWKTEAEAASTANLVLSGEQTVDSVALVAGDRILVKNQTDQTQNGIYVVSTSAWNRATDSSTGAQIAGEALFIRAGGTNVNTQWVNSNKTITLGFTNITYVQLNASSSYSAGTGLALTGTVFSIANTGVTAGTYTKVTVNAQGQVTTGGALASGDVTTALGYTPYDAANPAGYITGNQSITVSGDATGSGTTAISLTLANSGVTAGTYTKVTVDSKGRVTVGAALASSDVTTALGYTPLQHNETITVSGDASGSGTSAITLTLANSGVTAGTYNWGTVDAKGRVTAANNVPAGATTLTGDVTGSGTGSIATTLANSGVTAGTYTKVTVDAKGRVTVGAALASSDVTTALGYTPLQHNESITVSGDATGTGASAITLTLANSGVTTGTYTKVTVDTKGRVTIGANLNTSDVTTALGYTPVNKAGDTMTGALNLAAPVTLASAATVNIGAAASNSVNVTGTTTITAFDTIAAGATRVLYFQGVLTLTYNATSLILPGTANITTAAGDSAEFVSLGGGNWSCNWYTKANGQAVVTSGATSTTLTGDVTGTGTGTIATTLANSGVTAGTYTKVTVDAKGRVTVGAALASSDVTTALGYTPLALTGGTVTGTITMSGATITGVPTPVNASDVANKAYVDNALTNTSWKTEVQVATTANITLSGTQTIDGYAVQVGDRVLVKNQTNQTQNGIYVAASGAWSRASDNTTGAQILGSAVLVENGTTQGITQYVNNNTGTITVGTTNITFVQFGGGTTYTASTGLTLTGNAFSITNTGVTAGTYTKVTVNAQGQVTVGASLASSDVTTALGFTPVANTNAGIVSALGYTPANKAGDTFSGAVNFAPTATLASAATVNIGAASANDISITGTATITAFDTIAAGAVRKVTFVASGLTLTHNGSSLILPGAASIVTAAGDGAQFTSLGGGNWRCDYYQRASGQSVTGSPDATKLPLAGGTMSGALNQAPTATLASAATVNIGAASANDISMTGTTTITAFDTIAAGAVRHITFTGALTLTHNATSLILPGAASITTAAGDSAQFTSLGAGNWRCDYYQKANGQSVVTSAAAAAGSTSQVQYNNSGALAASATFTYDGSNILTLGGTSAQLQMGSTTQGTVTIVPVVTAATGSTLSLQGGNASGANNGGQLTVAGGSTGTSGNTAGNVTISSGTNSVNSANHGQLALRVGSTAVMTLKPDSTGNKPLINLAGPINFNATDTVASAATTPIGAVLANSVNVSGTTTITAFDTIAAGAERTVIFAGILTLTHNATSLILPSAANITTAAGDTAKFVSLGAGNWKCLYYNKANGQALVAGTTAAAGAGGNVQYNNGSNGFTASSALSFVSGSNNILTLGDTTAGHNAAITIPAPSTAASGNAFNINGSNANGANSGGSINISAGTTASAAGNGGTLILAGGVNSATGTQNGSIQLNTGANTNQLLKADLSSNFGGAINEAPTITLASAATVNIGAAAANDIIISGSVTITAFDSLNQAGGVRRTLRFSGALTLTHNGSSLILPGAASIVTAAGDVAEFVSIGVANSGQWKCVNYTKANGQSVVGAPDATKLPLAGGTMSGAINGAPPATLASAASVAIGAAASNDVTITGTTTITSFDTIAAGAIRNLTFAGALTLTHNGTSLILPGAASITTAAGDTAEFDSLGGGNWRCLGYTKANGQAVVASADATKLPLAGGTMTGAITMSGQQIIAPTLKAEGFVFFDNGTVSTGTATLTYTNGTWQRLQVGGAITIATASWPASGTFGELGFELVNGASATITWPTINWIKSDGTTTTTFASNGVTLQTSGTDFVILWSRDGGTTIYGKVIR